MRSPNGSETAAPPSYHDVMKSSGGSGGSGGIFSMGASKFGRMFGGDDEGGGGGEGDGGCKTPDGERKLDERMSKLEKKK